MNRLFPNDNTDLPVCSRDPKQAGQPSDAEPNQADLNLLPIDESSSNVACRLEAQPAPTKYSWLFISWQEIFRRIARKADPKQGTERHENNGLIILNNSPENLLRDILIGNEMLMNGQRAAHSNHPEFAGIGSVQIKNNAKGANDLVLELETQSNILRLDDLFKSETKYGPNGAQSNHHPRGLLMCEAKNALGWQERACLSLLVPPGEYITARRRRILFSFIAAHKNRSELFMHEWP